MQVPFFAASHGSWIRATPALSDDRLYVAGMRDVLVCLDARTGQEIWKAGFPDETRRSHAARLRLRFLAAGSSVEHVYVQAGAALDEVEQG